MFTVQELVALLQGFCVKLLEGFETLIVGFRHWLSDTRRLVPKLLQLLFDVSLLLSESLSFSFELSLDIVESLLWRVCREEVFADGVSEDLISL